MSVPYCLASNISNAPWYLTHLLSSFPKYSVTISSFSGTTCTSKDQSNVQTVWRSGRGNWRPFDDTIEKWHFQASTVSATTKTNKYNLAETLRIRTCKNQCSFRIKLPTNDDRLRHNHEGPLSTACTPHSHQRIQTPNPQKSRDLPCLARLL